MSAVRKSVFAIGFHSSVRSLCAEHLGYIEIRIVDDVRDRRGRNGCTGKSIHLGHVSADRVGRTALGGQISGLQLVLGLLFSGPVCIRHCLFLAVLRALAQTRRVQLAACHGLGTVIHRGDERVVHRLAVQGILSPILFLPFCVIICTVIE